MARQEAHSQNDLPARSRGAPNGAIAPAAERHDSGDQVTARQNGREVSDTEHRVRQALADHLTRSPYLPPMLAQSLATDVLSVPLATQPKQVGKATASNRQGRSTAEGGDYPLGRVDQGIVAASGALRHYLISRHDLPPQLVDQMIMHGRERALTGTISSGFPRRDLERLAADLVAERRLTPTLLLRSLCLGQLQFFEAAMAALAATTVERVQAMTYEEGPDNFFKLYQLAALPLGFYRAFRATIEVILQFGRDTARGWQRDITEEIISSLVKEYEQISPEDLEHVLSQLSYRLMPPARQGEALA